MRIHHLNCATMCPAPGRVRRLMPPRLVAHCLLVEGEDGLTLVDTGFGSGDLADPRRLGRIFTAAVGARFDPTETAIAQVRDLGFAALDVRRIVVTHLDLDHAGGLGDFPHASVHVHADELAAARRPTARERARYISAQWSHGPSWVEHRPDAGDSWFGFESVSVIDDDLVLVPLHGHTRGHAGVGVRRPEGGWLLHAGDAYFFHGEKERPPTCPPGLRGFQRLVEVDHASRVRNQERLRALHAEHGDEVTVFSAHDESEFLALAQASVDPTRSS
ncbi:MAG TPA: MBL fold metallo-hydrolase [Nocardioidaceae bacterium]|nr:MBL fold metallo-hydrolase [Nocardioidaceae bacterium]